VLDKRRWVTGTDGTYHIYGQFYRKLLCPDQIDNHIQQKPFPTTQSVTDQVSQVIVQDQGRVYQTGMLCQQNTIPFAVSQLI